MRIYVSSTSVDLKPFRQAVLDAIRGLGHEAVAMEDYRTATARCGGARRLDADRPSRPCRRTRSGVWLPYLTNRRPAPLT